MPLRELFLFARVEHPRNIATAICDESRESRSRMDWGDGGPGAAARVTLAHGPRARP
jgi:hypothetical protein